MSKKCNKGYPCGKTCISKTRKCRNQVTPTVGKALEVVVQQIDSKGEQRVNERLRAESRRKKLEYEVRRYFKEKADKNIEVLKNHVNNPDIKPMMALPSQFLESFLKNGSQNDFRTSGNPDYVKMRLRREQTAHGINPNKPVGESRPYYGYLDKRGGNSESFTNPYGDIKLEFKDSVKDWMTFTLGNSTGSGKAATSVRKPSIELFATFSEHNGEIRKPYMRESYENWDDLTNHGTYVEGQYHRQLTKDDIVAIHAPKAQHAKIKKMLKQQGLEHIEILPTRK